MLLKHKENKDEYVSEMGDGDGYRTWKKIICSKCRLSEISVKILIVYSKHSLRVISKHSVCSDVSV